MTDKIPTLDEWLSESWGKCGVCGFCESCGKDWEKIPFGKVAKESPNIWHWVCSRECMDQITKDIQIGTRYMKFRSGV